MLDLLDILGIAAASAGTGARDRVTDLLITLVIGVFPLLAVGVVMWAAGADLDPLAVGVSMTLAAGGSAASVRYAGRGNVVAVIAGIGSAAVTFCAFFFVAVVLAVLTLV